MTEIFKHEIKKIDSFDEFFAVIKKHYKTEEKLGPLSKASLLANIGKIIEGAGVKQR